MKKITTFTKEIMPYKQFALHIGGIKKFIDGCDGVNKALSALDPDFNSFSLGRVETMILELLASNFGPHGYEEISYFIYDLDWGKKWKAGMITKQDKDIKMKTVKDLYKELISTLK